MMHGPINIRFIPQVRSSFFFTGRALPVLRVKSPLFNIESHCTKICHAPKTSITALKTIQSPTQCAQGTLSSGVKRPEHKVIHLLPYIEKFKNACSMFPLYLHSIWAGWSEDRIPVGAIPVPVQTDPGAHPTFCTMGTGSLPQGKAAGSWR